MKSFGARPQCSSATMLVGVRGQPAENSHPQLQVPLCQCAAMSSLSGVTGSAEQRKSRDCFAGIVGSELKGRDLHTFDRGVCSRVRPALGC